MMEDWCSFFGDGAHSPQEPDVESSSQDGKSDWESGDKTLRMGEIFQLPNPLPMYAVRAVVRTGNSNVIFRSPSGAT